MPLGTSALWTVPALIISLFASYGLLRARKVRLLFLLGASYVFYAHWDWRFLPLIFGSSTADWLLGNAIGRATDPRRRKLWLVGTVVMNLGVLAVFKYFNFGIDAARAALAALGCHPPEIALQRRAAGRHQLLHVRVDELRHRRLSRATSSPHKSYLEYLTLRRVLPAPGGGPDRAPARSLAAARRAAALRAAAKAARRCS